jgi:hypothetical protein
METTQLPPLNDEISIYVFNRDRRIEVEICKIYDFEFDENHRFYVFKSWDLRFRSLSDINQKFDVFHYFSLEIIQSSPNLFGRIGIHWIYIILLVFESCQKTYYLSIWWWWCLQNYTFCFWLMWSPFLCKLRSQNNDF